MSGRPKRRNRIQLLGSYLRRVPVLPGMPIALIVEATNRCNLSCIMCPREQVNAYPQDMSLELFKRIVDDAKGYVQYIDFSFRGEPLLNKNIFQMIAYVKKNGINTSLQTNGLLLGRETGKLLLDAGLDLLTVSLDASSAEIYDKVRPGGDFYRALENTQELIRLNDKNRMTIIAQMVRMAENYSELQAFKNYWKSRKNILVRIKPFSSRAGLVHTNIPSYGGRQPVRCSRLWRSMVICADGKAVPCCNDFSCQYMLGDLNTDSIGKVWNGSKLVELRRLHCRNKLDAIPMCGKCEFFRTNLYKQAATFFCEDLTLRRLLAFFDLS